MTYLGMEKLLLGIYKHTKSGKVYQLLGLAHHTETLEQCVVYQGLDDCEEFGTKPLWVRPKKMFFEDIVLDGKSVPRFEYMGPSQ